MSMSTKFTVHAPIVLGPGIRPGGDPRGKSMYIYCNVIFRVFHWYSPRRHASWYRLAMPRTHHARALNVRFFGSIWSVLPRPRYVRLAGNLGNTGSVLKSSALA